TNNLYENISDNSTAESVTTASDSANIISDISVVLKKCSNKLPSPVKPYFLQKTIDNKSVLCKANKLILTQQLLSFKSEATISTQILTTAQKTKFNMLVAEWIISDTLPFSISIVQKAFTVMQKDIQSLFEQISSKISITLDIWTSHANVPFICEEISAKLCSVLAAFNITNKILCATTDEGSNMISAMRLLKDNLVLKNCNFHFQSHHCLAYILNLIITTGLSPIKLSIKKVHNFVNAISSSSSITQNFKELRQLVGEGEATRKIP
ncbi:9534_t:CDS:2, partial [Cetraspora pellucida]